MKRSFTPAEFPFDDSDLDTPASFMACLNRMKPESINTPGYASKLFQAVTNQDYFDGDDWFDICFERKAIPQLQEFAKELVEWHEKNDVKQQFMPNMLAGSFLNTPHVKEELTAIGFVPGEMFQKAPVGEIKIEVSQTSFGM